MFLYSAVMAAWQTVRVINKYYFWLQEDIWTCLASRQQKRHLERAYNVFLNSFFCWKKVCGEKI